MTTEVISFDAERASNYIARALVMFLVDPADTDHQRGYLSALLTVYEEALGKAQLGDRIALLKAQLS